ncbi:SCO family protein [Novosphingobium album (ex Liu et al. 2023)]|uniref:SCO family protein n=1 Tax=Novosphingobium album (ex Liu et al. 2023) TaxID=3031130 RepID=A0ABT5WSZ0_9SPHN|nr:SCO family protein [Novosphingobium album (ex Liu et al. 2023)]MDE8653147.1 SCO family protein [Novosphingobium album (ex Liu et al. 2023)]
MNRHAMTYHRTLAALLLPLLPLALTACGSGGAPTAPAQRPPLEGAAIGGPFTLVDKDGKTVRWQDFAGKYRIVYFGYTFCPDACPFDVQAMMMGFNRFAQAHPGEAAKVQPIFISIDPRRDTPAVVGQWTAAFSPRLLGLTGTPEQVAGAAKAFAVYYAKGKDTTGGYLMDHSRIAYLMDPEGKPLAMLPVDKGVADKGAAVAAELEKWVK